MKERYGDKKGEEVFHATAKKRDMEPKRKLSSERRRKLIAQYLQDRR